MSWQDNYEYTYMVGIGGILLTVIGWISLRRGANLTQAQMESNAKICYIIGTLKIIAGIFVLTSNMAGGELWGFMLILFGVLWVVRGNRWKRVALVVRARNQLRQNAGNVAIAADAANNNNNNNNNANANGANNKNSGGVDYRRISDMDGPEGPNAIIIAQQGGVGGVSSGNSDNSPFIDKAARVDKKQSNEFISQSQFGVVAPIPIVNYNNSITSQQSGAVPPAAFPGPANGPPSVVVQSVVPPSAPYVPEVTIVGQQQHRDNNVIINDNNKNNNNQPSDIQITQNNSNNNNNNNNNMNDDKLDIETTETEKNNSNDTNNNNNNNTKKKGGVFSVVGKKNNKKKNDELTVPLRSSVDETAPMAYNITIGTFDDENVSANTEGEATYT